MLTSTSTIPALHTLPASTLAARNADPETQIKEAARAYEAVFLNTMLQSMFSGLEEGGAWGGGAGSETWQGMLVDEFAKNIAGRGGIGIAATLERELLTLQEIPQ
ncbi:chemotaxis protein [Microvirga tunisiensis]|uniref:Chemotaxis protein n=2 Tax=Pannonibacter tanglangensis TaxID=2750084 RepID=A0ABW9ZFA5_9HYPH|nr:MULTISPECIES: rod-binding protein [unclassified Pannonibacter]NBN63533.1 chemotaxis protein [Pannonibacter sp. XCT-34]NBN77170.1 chemotaxis protein [Pannonibacter sp. XCT-53]